MKWSVGSNVTSVVTFAHWLWLMVPAQSAPSQPRNILMMKPMAPSTLHPTTRRIVLLGVILSLDTSWPLTTGPSDHDKTEIQPEKATRGTNILTASHFTFIFSVKNKRQNCLNGSQKRSHKTTGICRESEIRKKIKMISIWMELADFEYYLSRLI